MTITVGDVLKKATFRAIDVEQVLDPNGSVWINFDPELGYVQNRRHICRIFTSRHNEIEHGHTTAQRCVLRQALEA